MQAKTCKKCGDEKALDQYDADKRCKDGYKKCCRMCSNIVKNSSNDFKNNINTRNPDKVDDKISLNGFKNKSCDTDNKPSDVLMKICSKWFTSTPKLFLSESHKKTSNPNCMNGDKVVIQLIDGTTTFLFRR